MEVLGKERERICSILLACCIGGLMMGMVVLQPVKVYAAPANDAIGFVDYDRLLNQHPDTQKAREQDSAEMIQAQKEFAEKSAKLSDQEKQELSARLMQRVEKKRQELYTPILEKINTALKETAVAKGINIVLQKGVVYYGGLDITDDILKKISGKG